jgi:putative SOS response-associated peptidase YedK
MTAKIHDRMPVILDQQDVSVWLDPAAKQSDVTNILKPCPAKNMDTYPVSNVVNNARNNGPECIDPQMAQQSLFAR